MKIKFIKEYRALVGEALSGSATCAVGTVVDTTEKSAMWLIDNGFAEEVKESGWWKPKYGEKYFYIGHNSYVHCCLWRNDQLDNGRLRLGLVFKTEEAGTRCCDYLKAIATVRQDEGVLTPEEINRFYRSESGDIFVITTNFPILTVSRYENKFFSSAAGAIYFDTFDRANASLDKHLTEWKIIANYDWSRE